jgi:ribonuclease D
LHVATSDLPRLELFSDTKFKGKLFDTKVAAKIILTNTDKVGMDDLITQLINPKFQKDRNITASLWDLDPEQWSDKMIEYAMNDVLYLHALRNSLENLAEKRNLSEVLEDSMEALPNVCQLYKYGYDASVLTY